MLFKYCPECGAVLKSKTIGDEGEIPFCGVCNRPWFGFSYPCVICLVTDGEKYALIKQTYGTDHRVCIAGFVKEKETAEQAALREVKEEIGLDVMSARYLNSYYYPKHDNLMLGFVCLVRHDDFKLSGEVESADWYSLDQARDLLSVGTVVNDLLRDWLNSNK